MCDSNIIFNECKFGCELCATERSQSSIMIGEDCPSKTDHDSFNEYRTSSSEKQLSDDVCCSPDSIQQEDFSRKVHTSIFKSENTEKKLASRSENQTRLKKSFKNDGRQGKKKEDVFEVICKGTKLMKTMNFPTVIVKHISRNFEKSRLYHILLELTTKEFTVNIPAIMFSSPYAHRKTRFGELLPLGLMKNSKSFYLTPILQRKRFRPVFRSGCSLKIKLLIPGRAHVEHGGCWNKYDLSWPIMKNLPKKFIERDIRQMCSHIFNRVIPLRHRIQKCKQMQRNKTSLRRKPSKTWVANLEDEDTPLESVERTYPHFGIKSKILKQNHRVDNSQAFFTKSCSTKMNAVKDINYSILNRESLSFPDELDTYWSTLVTI